MKGQNDQETKWRVKYVNKTSVRNMTNFVKLVSEYKLKTVKSTAKGEDCKNTTDEVCK